MMFYDGSLHDAASYMAGGCGVLPHPRLMPMQPPYVQRKPQLCCYDNKSVAGPTMNAIEFNGQKFMSNAIPFRNDFKQMPHADRRSDLVGFSCCCVPTGCTKYASDLINPADPRDAVRVTCSSPGCSVGRWMHADCFKEWDRRVSYITRCCEQAVPSAKHVLAGQLRMCICGRGFLDKDPNYMAPAIDVKSYGQLSRKSSHHQLAAVERGATVNGLYQHLHQLLQQDDQQQQHRLRSSSFSSTGSGSCSSSLSAGGGSSSCGYSSTSVTPPLSPPRTFFPSSRRQAATPPPQLYPLSTSGMSSTRPVFGIQSGPSVNDDPDHGLMVRNGSTSSSSNRPLPQFHQVMTTAGLGQSSQIPMTSQLALGYHNNHTQQQHRQQTSGANLFAVSAAPSASNGRRPEVDSVVSGRPQPNARGNIFQHRADLSVYRSIRPSARNAYCIQLDDDGPHGNNDTRKFLMHKLTSRGVAAFQCVSCRQSLPVYDEFPVIDGALFLSPRSYDASNTGSPDSSSSRARLSVPVVYNRRMLSLHAVCLDCLGQKVTEKSTGQRSVRCRFCASRWSLGSTLQLGTMYTYDVFACAPCCAERQRCRGCAGQKPTGDADPKSFSDFSRLSSCVHCGLEDYHFVRQFDDVFRCTNDDDDQAATPIQMATTLYDSQILRRRL